MSTIINHITLMGEADLIDEAVRRIKDEQGGETNMAVARMSPKICDIFLVRRFALTGLEADLSARFPGLLVFVRAVRELPGQTPEAFKG